MEVNVNLLSVLGATVVSMIIGSLWYSPLVLGKPWMKAMGMSEADSARMRSEAPKAMGGMLISALIMSYVVAHFVALLNITDTTSALQFSFWSWLGLIATTQFAGVLFERRKFALFAISSSYYLVQLIAITFIFLRWP